MVGSAGAGHCARAKSKWDVGEVGGEELKLGGEGQYKTVMMAHGEQERPNQQGTCQ